MSRHRRWPFQAHLHGLARLVMHDTHITRTRPHINHQVMHPQHTLTNPNCFVSEELNRVHPFSSKVISIVYFHTLVRKKHYSNVFFSTFSVIATTVYFPESCFNLTQPGRSTAAVSTTNCVCGPEGVDSELLEICGAHARCIFWVFQALQAKPCYFFGEYFKEKTRRECCYWRFLMAWCHLKKVSVEEARQFPVGTRCLGLCSFFTLGTRCSMVQSFLYRCSSV